MWPPVCNYGFSLADFEVLSLYLTFDIVIIICPVWVSLCLSYLGLNMFPRLEYLSISFIRLRRYSAIISSNRFSLSLFLLRAL